jgi:hypothetical protein
MSKRKQYLIDKKFQFKTTFSIIGMVTIVSGLIITIIGSSIVYNNARIQNIYEIEDQIVQVLTTQNTAADGDTAAAAFMKDIARNHFNNMETLQKIINYNKYLVIILIIIVLLQGALLYFLLILKTHRISGPIYVMSNYIKELLNGKYPNPRALRDKDELKDFYELFKELVSQIKKNAGK